MSETNGNGGPPRTPRQGLGGRTLGSDSPLFGGKDIPPPVVTREAPAHEPPAWDPREDDYASPEKAAEEMLAAAAELEKLLPAAEPDRSLDDWGRSETVVSVMEPILNFYYRYWFRVEVSGIENVPDAGGALLVANHSGALPPDAPMIM